jgi:T5SS/PEP-CTERM-associated repeat protein
MMSLPSRVPRLMPRMASIVLAVAIALPATGALALPTVVNEFNSLYVGVDGVGAASVSGTATYDFVGIGVRSTDPQLTGHAPFAGNPVGTLDVGVGATLNLNYLPGTIGAPVFRPLDNSVVVGNSLGTTGTLNVSGGAVSAPMLFVGQADGLRPSTGTVNITAGGQFNATLDSSATGPLPGFPAISIGRGLGSVGTINVSGAGSRLDASVGMMSLAREGNGTLNVQAGGVVAVGNTVFLSTISSAGSATVRVDGPGSMLDAGAMTSWLVSPIARPTIRTTERPYLTSETAGRSRGRSMWAAAEPSPGTD